MLICILETGCKRLLFLFPWIKKTDLTEPGISYCLLHHLMVLWPFGVGSERSVVKWSYFSHPVLHSVSLQFLEQSRRKERSY